MHQFSYRPARHKGLTGNVQHTRSTGPLTPLTSFQGGNDEINISFIHVKNVILFILWWLVSWLCLYAAKHTHRENSKLSYHVWHFEITRGESR